MLRMGRCSLMSQYKDERASGVSGGMALVRNNLDDAAAGRTGDGSADAKIEGTASDAPLWYLLGARRHICPIFDGDAQCIQAGGTAQRHLKAEVDVVILTRRGADVLARQGVPRDRRGIAALLVVNLQPSFQHGHVFLPLAAAGEITRLHVNMGQLTGMEKGMLRRQRREVAEIVDVTAKTHALQDQLRSAAQRSGQGVEPIRPGCQMTRRNPGDAAILLQLNDIG